jgi:molybdopterin-guanine dinucleotide biosynthesis protein A
MPEDERLAPGMVGGYVLTGGSSRRMGRDKALLAWRGTTLVQWIASQVREAVGNVTLVGTPDRYARLGLAAIGEDYPGLGPVSGLEAALRHSTTDWNLVVACDMPRLDAGALTRLATAAVRYNAPVCAVRNHTGGLEPLCAVYHRGLLGELSAALNEGRLKLRDLLARWDVVAWEPVDSVLTLNLNEPEDWDDLQRARSSLR